MEKMERKSCPECGAKMSLVYGGPVIRKKDEPIGLVCSNCWHFEKVKGIFLREKCINCGGRVVPEFVPIRRGEAIPYLYCLDCRSMFRPPALQLSEE